LHFNEFTDRLQVEISEKLFLTLFKMVVTEARGGSSPAPDMQDFYKADEGH
jgi:hypothetical protein